MPDWAPDAVVADQPHVADLDCMAVSVVLQCAICGDPLGPPFMSEASPPMNHQRYVTVSDVPATVISVFGVVTLPAPERDPTT